MTKNATETEDILEDLRDYAKAFEGRSGTAGYAICARNAADTIERLQAGLIRARDTFADMGKMMAMLQRPLVASACEVARLGCDEVLSSGTAPAKVSGIAEAGHSPPIKETKP